MSEVISFCVPGQPMAWKRPGGRGKMRFERKEVTSQKALFVYAAREEMGDREPLMVPIHLFVRATFDIPELAEMETGRRAPGRSSTPKNRTPTTWQAGG